MTHAVHINSSYNTNILCLRVIFYIEKAKPVLCYLLTFMQRNVCVQVAKLKIYVAKDDLFVADSMEDAVCNQANLLASRVVRGVPRVENQAFVNYRPGFGY